MTLITCEFCGPERVAPHDVNCPTRQPQVVQIKALTFDGPVVLRTVQKGDLIGYTSDYPHFPPIIPNPEPLITRNPDHETMPGRFGAVCKCGYDPHETHPEAGRGQLFAYVGYHIRETSHQKETL